MERCVSVYPIFLSRRWPFEYLVVVLMLQIFCHGSSDGFDQKPAGSGSHLHVVVQVTPMVETPARSKKAPTLACILGRRLTTITSIRGNGISRDEMKVILEMDLSGFR